MIWMSKTQMKVCIWHDFRRTSCMPHTKQCVRNKVAMTCLKIICWYSIVKIWEVKLRPCFNSQGLDCSRNHIPHMLVNPWLPFWNGSRLLLKELLQIWRKQGCTEKCTRRSRVSRVFYTTSNQLAGQLHIQGRCTHIWQEQQVMQQQQQQQQQQKKKKKKMKKRATSWSIFRYG